MLNCTAIADVVFIMSGVAAMINYHGVKVFPVLLGLPYNAIFNLSGVINQKNFGKDRCYAKQLELEWPTDEGCQ
mgnify:CR=1 FL=1